jgi:alkylation response protein AidB-like acyl-CoA dehydrogenase
MDLSLTLDERAFQDEVRAFLDETLTPELRAAGRLATSVFSEPEFNLPWQRKLHARGWAAPGWPTEYGGAGWGELKRAIFAAECARAGAPSLSPMGLRMVGPCLMGHGTDEQKAFFLPRILSGEDYWCQGYSEPGAGSDLASLQLRADSDGDDYVLNGSKIWTTQAHHANRMFCLVRTRFEGKPQQGITFLLLEVFFDNVRVPKTGRVGEENQGWTVAKYLLEFGRGGGWRPG